MKHFILYMYHSWYEAEHIVIWFVIVFVFYEPMLIDSERHWCRFNVEYYIEKHVFSVCSDSQCAITFCVIQVLSCSDSQCAITFCVVQVLSCSDSQCAVTFCVIQVLSIK